MTFSGNLTALVKLDSFLQTLNKAFLESFDLIETIKDFSAKISVSHF